MSSGQEVGQIFGDGVGPATALLRSPTVIIASIGLWGMNVYFFRLFKINYVYVLNLDLVNERRSQAQASEAAAASTGVSSGGGGGSNPNATELKRSSSISEIIAKNANAPATMDINGNSSETTTSDLEMAPMVQTDAAAPSSSVTPAVAGNGGAPATPTRSGDAAVLPIPKASNDRGGVAGSSPGIHNRNGSASTSDDTEETSALINASPSSSGDPSIGCSDSGVSSNLALTSPRLLCLSASLLVLLHFQEYVWIDVWGGSAISAIFAFYAMVAIAVSAPLPQTAWIRFGVQIAFWRAIELLNPRMSFLNSKDPPRPIPFVDVFFADAMCSMSKVFFDWGMLFHLASHYPDPVPPSAHSIIIPSLFASLPYVIRARQCLIMYTVGRFKSDPKRYSHLLNALKYSTSLFPLIVSAYEKTINDEEVKKSLERLLVVLLAINAFYSLMWDIIMDWGMMQNPTAVLEQTVCVGGVTSGLVGAAAVGGTPPPLSNGGVGAALPPGGVSSARPNCVHACLRPRLRFGLMTSAGILIADAVLRFCWLLRFVEGRIFANVDAYILCTQLLEAFRRAIWNLLRVEWENIKQIRAARSAANKSASAMKESSSSSSQNASGIFRTNSTMEEHKKNVKGKASMKD